MILSLGTEHPHLLNHQWFEGFVKDYPEMATLPQWYAALGELVAEGKLTPPKGRIKLKK